MIKPLNVVLEERITERAWIEFCAGVAGRTFGRPVDACITAWKYTVSESGPLLSARVDGVDAAEAVRLFANGGLALHSPCVPSPRPQLDCTVPGRMACVWLSDGVWVELWHPDAVQDQPKPTRPVHGLSRIAARFRSPSGRLPYTRRRKETPAP